MKKYVAPFLLLSIPVLGFAADLHGSWTLEKSEITYTVTHPLHVVHGKSHGAKGKGTCTQNQCDFHIGVLVKSFDSGDANRDLHMLETTKGALYPLIDVVAHVTEVLGQMEPRQIVADVIVKFAGKTATYPKVKLDVMKWTLDEAQIKGTIPLNIKDFDITPPALLGLPIKNEVPVELDLLWKRADSKEKK